MKLHAQAFSKVLILNMVIIFLDLAQKYIFLTGLVLKRPSALF